MALRANFLITESLPIISMLSSCFDRGGAKPKLKYMHSFHYGLSPAFTPRPVDLRDLVGWNPSFSAGCFFSDQIL